MKKLFLLAVAAAFMMTSCSENEENDVSLSKMSYTLYHSQTENIQGENVSSIDWDSDNEFVATISDGVIKGQFVGKTNVRGNARRLAFSVEVKPKYNLYDEPDMDWGASMATIKSRYGTPYWSNSESLMYKSANSNVPYYMYYFENGGLKFSYAVAKLSASYALVDFLTERYLAADVDMNTYQAAFIHCYGKKSDPKCDYGVGFTYNSSIGGFIVSYFSMSTPGSPIEFIVTEGGDTRANIEMPRHIEEIFVKNNIKVE